MERIICCKCNKKLKKSEVKHGYGVDFCKPCYEEYKRNAEEEVSRGLKEIGL